MNITHKSARVSAGIDNICEVAHIVGGARVGLITSPTGVTRSLIPTKDVIARLCRLDVIFSPEHGLNGSGQAGMGDPQNVPMRDASTGAEVIPLYGKQTAPDGETLSRLDFVMYDIQDVGARFYTYLTTLTRSMKACAEAGVPMMVFDRPGMIGLDRCEGGILDESFASFVGEYAVPARLGLTVGEYALYINETRKIGCSLTVVPCEGLNRHMYYSDTGLTFINPSPNIPSEECALNYVGTCIFEGTNVSEGRGTTTPFSVIGAPWLDADRLISRMEVYGIGGVRLRKTFFTPCMSKYSGISCEGIQLHVTDRDRYQPFECAVRLFDEIRLLFPDFSVSKSVDNLFGSDKLRSFCIGADKITSYLKANDALLENFKKEASPFKIYK